MWRREGIFLCCRRELVWRLQCAHSIKLHKRSPELQPQYSLIDRLNNWISLFGICYRHKVMGPLVVGGCRDICCKFDCCFWSLDRLWLKTQASQVCPPSPWECRAMCPPKPEAGRKSPQGTPHTHAQLKTVAADEVVCSRELEPDYPPVEPCTAA